MFFKEIAERKLIKIDFQKFKNNKTLTVKQIENT